MGAIEDDNVVVVDNCLIKRLEVIIVDRSPKLRNNSKDPTNCCNLTARIVISPERGKVGKRVSNIFSFACIGRL